MHAFISYMSITRKCPATCARKYQRLESFKYLTITILSINKQSSTNLETPKLDKRLPK